MTYKKCNYSALTGAKLIGLCVAIPDAWSDWLIDALSGDCKNGKKAHHEINVICKMCMCNDDWNIDHR